MTGRLRKERFEVTCSSCGLSKRFASGAAAGAVADTHEDECAGKASVEELGEDDNNE